MISKRLAASSFFLAEEKWGVFEFEPSEICDMVSFLSHREEGFHIYNKCLMSPSYHWVDDPLQLPPSLGGRWIQGDHLHPSSKRGERGTFVFMPQERITVVPLLRLQRNAYIFWLFKQFMLTLNLAHLQRDKPLASMPGHCRAVQRY